MRSEPLVPILASTMRRPPPVHDFARFPVTSATIALAALVSTAAWSGRDLSFLTEDPHLGRGELWRLATSAFPHVNLFHLIFNVYWVWGFGTQVEGAFGSWRTLGTFVLLAVVSGAAEYALLGGGVGLSGVGYGLFGMLWILNLRDARFADAIDKSTILLFVGWFFLCVLLTAQGVMPVANVAHAAGAGMGGVLGFLASSRGRSRALAAAGTAIVTVGTVLGATVWRPSINLSPDRGDAEARLGHSALLQNGDQEAVAWLSESTRLDPHDAGVWFNLGIAHQRLSRYREAEAAYQRAYRLRPDDAEYEAAHRAMREAIASGEQAPR
jgi:membrane associated rhomboid family serine protease